MVATPEQQPKLTYQRRRQTVPFFVERLTDASAIEMMQIPAGTFIMGSPEDELERLSREGPPHEVNVPSFFMGKYPVTQAQWKAVAALPQVSRKLEPDPSAFKGEKRPVENVSWYDAVEFCDRLSAHTGREYRLPTEAEWEYACRAGTTTPFHFGETITTDLANYNGVDGEIGRTSYKGAYGRGPLGKYRQETTPIDYFSSVDNISNFDEVVSLDDFCVANTFGLCDVHGNVWEWCQDHWHDNYEGAPTDGSAWLTDDKSARRILRGGSWFNGPRHCRSASRLYGPPVLRFDYIGFRVVCSAPRTLP